MSSFDQYTSEPVAPEGTPSAEERQWGMFVHLATLSGLLIPLGSILGPLIVWLIKKDTMPFVDDQGKEALNFQITVTAVCLVVGIVAFPLMLIGIGFLLFGLVLILGIGALVMSVVAGIKANEGVAYRYPFTIRLIR